MTEELLKNYQSTGNQYISRGRLNNNNYRPVDLVIQFNDKSETPYVRKEIPYNDEKEPNYYFKREVSFLALAQNMNLPFVKMREFVYPSPEESGYIIMEYMKGGDLMSVIRQYYNLPGYKAFEITSTDSKMAYDYEISASSSSSFEKLPIDFNNTRKMIIMYGLAVAIKFLHDNNIFHRDIKPQNVLLDEKGNPFLSDFGLAREISDPKNLLLSGKRGTCFYMPQEVFLSDTPDCRSDIYAFGVTVLLMLTGELKMNDKGHIFNALILDENKLMEKITDGCYYIIPDNHNVPQCFKDLITSCCQPDPTKRITIDNIVSKFENGEYTFSDVDQTAFQQYRNNIHK